MAEKKTLDLLKDAFDLSKRRKFDVKIMTAKQYVVYTLKLLQGQIEPEQRKGLAVMTL